MPPQSINFGNETKSQVTEKGVIFRSELEITVRHGCCIYPSAFQAQACLWGVGGLKQRARSMELSAESNGQQKALFIDRLSQLVSDRSRGLAKASVPLPKPSCLFARRRILLDLCQWNSPRSSALPCGRSRARRPRPREASRSFRLT